MKRLLCLLLLVLVVSVPAYGAKSTGQAAVDEWAAVAQNTVREGATTSISAYYACSLHIDMAVTSTTVHTGTRIIVQVSSNTSGDEDWVDYYDFVGPTTGGEGAANPEALAGAEAAGQTVLGVVSTTGRYDNDDGVFWIFLLDDTVADSEMCLLVSHVVNTSVTVQDGLTNAHDASDILYDLAKNYIISIPPEFNRVRVIYDNTYDSDGSQVHCKTRISYMDGI